MHKSRRIFFGLVLLCLLGWFGLGLFGETLPQEVSCTMEARLCPDGSSVGRSGPRCEFAPCPEGNRPEGGMRPGGGDESEERKESEEVLPSQKEPGFVPPLSRAEARVTKKPFGILITPETSPVQLERFRGYHTGTDFEILEEEGEADVAVEAICQGPVLLKQWVSGYGGVVVQRCLYGQEPLTVLYGHLRLMSVERVVGEELSSGETIGVLGTGESEETDGERRHLHLGIHQGSAVNMRGYVSASSELGAWLNPCELLRFRP